MTGSSQTADGDGVAVADGRYADEKYNMRIFSENGTGSDRSEFNTSDYPVNVYFMDLSKLRTTSVHWHWHDEMEIVYVTDGIIEFMTNNASFQCSAGEGIVVNGSVMHNITGVSEKPGDFYSIIFAPELILGKKGGSLWGKYWIPFQNAAFQVMKLSPDIPWKIRMLEYAATVVEADKKHEPGYELAIKGALCSCMSVIASQLKPELQPDSSIESTDETRVKTAITFIKLHYSENIALEDIAKSTNVSKSECCRYFQRTLHVTPFEYLMRYRVFAAAGRLYDKADHVTSISELAMSVGFNNISYFNKLFRKYMMCTPTQYRKSMFRNNDSNDPDYMNFIS